MDKLKLHSPNLSEANVKKLAELFPNCVTESHSEMGEIKKVIDFDLLRQELSDNIVEGPQERYQLNWPGKREALLAANAPVARTLRPCREESLNFDTTQNLYIEGDNLDALKLLQENYLGKIKMIYIDPPYNTGNDFIYEDDFAESTAEYLQKSAQKDEEGNRLVANTDSNGRFHSDWLSMMYPRLKLARNLLRDDGVIFISIDDNEQSNVKKLCDEVFGESNYLASLVWDRNRKNDARYFSVGHEYMVVYSKNETFLSDHQIVFRGEKEGIDGIKTEFESLLKQNLNWDEVKACMLKYYSTILPDDPRYPLTRFNKFDEKGPYRNDGNINWPGGGGPKYLVLHPVTQKPCKVPISGWRYPTPERFWEEVEKGRIVFGNDETTVPRIRTNLFENNTQVMTSVHYSYAQTAANKFNAIFDGVRVFENPKPFSDLRRLTDYITGPDDVVLDFFSGSSSTAHAVMQLNAEDGGNRKFIMVQLPEVCDENSEAYKAGFKTIAEIGKERIRRAGMQIKNELEKLDDKRKTKEDSSLFSDSENSSTLPRPSALDVGFRVLKVDSSNMNEIYYQPDQLKKHDLFSTIENIKPDRTAEDLLFQVMLDWGTELDKPIKIEAIAGQQVFFVDENVIAACFANDGSINEDFVKELAKHKPLRVVFRDAGFKDDSVKINVEQIFKLLSPHTDVKTI